MGIYEEKVLDALYDLFGWNISYKDFIYHYCIKSQVDDASVLVNSNSATVLLNYLKDLLQKSGAINVAIWPYRSGAIPKPTYYKGLYKFYYKVNNREKLECVFKEYIVCATYVKNVPEVFNKIMKHYIKLKNMVCPLYIYENNVPKGNEIIEFSIPDLVTSEFTINYDTVRILREEIFDLMNELNIDIHTMKNILNDIAHKYITKF